MKSATPKTPRVQKSARSTVKRRSYSVSGPWGGRAPPHWGMGGVNVVESARNEISDPENPQGKQTNQIRPITAKLWPYMS